MRLPWRRRRTWPKELERRKPENSALREELERGHRAHVKAHALAVAELTEENQRRVDFVDAAVRALSSRG